MRDTTTNCDETFTYTITGSSGPLQMINPLAVNQADFNTTDILCNGLRMEPLLLSLLEGIHLINILLMVEHF